MATATVTRQHITNGPWHFFSHIVALVIYDIRGNATFDESAATVTWFFSLFCSEVLFLGTRYYRHATSAMADLTSPVGSRDLLVTCHKISAKTIKYALSYEAAKSGKNETTLSSWIVIATSSRQ